MAGALWPGGPAEAPCVITLVGHEYLVAPQSGLRLAFATARGIAMVPDLLIPEDREDVLRRLDDPMDILDWHHLESGTVFLVAQLAGIASGINGWRAAMRLSHALVAQWPQSAGMVMSTGVRLADAPLWELMAAMYSQCIDNPSAKDTDVRRAKMSLYAPLQGEPEWMRDTKPPAVVAEGQSRAAAMELFARANGGRGPVIPTRCNDCGRMQGHDRGCVHRPQEAESVPAVGAGRCRLCGVDSGHDPRCPAGPSAAAPRPVRRGLPKRGEAGHKAQ